jgi:hypothetical protein
MNDRDFEEFHANCKIGSKKLEAGEFHHGLKRIEMKFLEELT